MQESFEVCIILQLKCLANTASQASCRGRRRRRSVQMPHSVMGSSRLLSGHTFLEGEAATSLWDWKPALWMLICSMASRGWMHVHIPRSNLLKYLHSGGLAWNPFRRLLWYSKNKHWKTRKYYLHKIKKTQYRIICIFTWKSTKQPYLCPSVGWY